MNKAFTLIELMVVIALIALLAAIAWPNTLRARQTAEDAKMEKELHSIYAAITMFENQHQRKPTTWEELRPYIVVNESKYELNPN